MIWGWYSRLLFPSAGKSFTPFLSHLPTCPSAANQKPEMHQCDRFDPEGILTTPDIRHL
jgi:hypothetical protein